jgi:transposase
MIRYLEILRLNHQEMSQRGIAAATGHSRRIVKEVIERAQSKEISYPFGDNITDLWLQNFLFPEKNPVEKGRKIPNYEYLHKELARSGVTLSLLWEEYKRQCEDENKIPYSYRQFCREYREFALKTKATLRIKRKPGEIMEVDWAGSTLQIYNALTGEQIKAYVFVATLPCSQYSYVEAFLSMDLPSWIAANKNALEFFGGSPNLIVPDNLRTGVDKSSRYLPIVNRAYQEFAEYYNTAIVPARVRKPRDKGSVEGNVGHVSTWIIAALRNEKYFSITELNEAVREKLNEVNSKPFQKKDTSRLEAFENEEKFALTPLPARPFELSMWKSVTVPYDYHIEVDKMFYSVPYEYIKHQVEIRETRIVIEVFFKNLRIASHKRLYGTVGQMSTLEQHMPENHQKYVNHTPQAVFEWARKNGPFTELVLKSIFKRYSTEQQALKVSLGFMKLADTHSPALLEEACMRALQIATNPDLKSVQALLTSSKEKVKSSVNKTTKDKKHTDTKITTTNHGFTRGASYYGGMK